MNGIAEMLDISPLNRLSSITTVPEQGLEDWGWAVFRAASPLRRLQRGLFLW